MNVHGHGEKVLIVEDEQILAMDLRAQLCELGYDVVGTASTGKEALRLAEECRPDLVLMDIQLHGSMDGITAAVEIRQQWQTPVIFMTAFAGEETLLRAKLSGLYGYLPKPFEAKHLNAAVSLALQHHRMMREAFQEHGWLRTLLAGMSDGVIAADLQGQVRFLNPVAENLTGWSLAEALGRPIEEICVLRQEDGTPLERCQLRHVLATRRAVARGRFLLISRRDSTLFVDDSAAPIHDAQGIMTGAVTVITDVTEREHSERERQRLQAELERSHDELSRFPCSLLHDLRAPATSIAAAGELLKKGKEGELTPGQLRIVEMMMESARGIQRLASSMLNYAQIGIGEISFEPVPVNEVVQAVRDRLSEAIGSSGAQIEYESLPVIQADRTQLEQVFQNLLSNAIHYRKPGTTPRISISAKEIGEDWAFAVEDNGQGIPAEWRVRIFEPLKTLHGRDVPGTGLGLALCQRIIERHGGRVWAESAGSGRGTTIRFVLPFRRLANG
ncbi:MAG TPA: ATP-binding protein [Candidatus Limnocylindrales bacterium]|nr:ATP-binding protein [Candidatus Limnocylindrales bacterium]